MGVLMTQCGSRPGNHFSKWREEVCSFKIVPFFRYWCTEKIAPQNINLFFLKASLSIETTGLVCLLWYALVLRLRKVYRIKVLIYHLFYGSDQSLHCPSTWQTLRVVMAGIRSTFRAGTVNIWNINTHFHSRNIYVRHSNLSKENLGLNSRNRSWVSDLSTIRYICDEVRFSGCFCAFACSRWVPLCFEALLPVGKKAGCWSCALARACW